jgi:hypothetical protein
MIDLDRKLQDYADLMEEVMGPVDVHAFLGARRTRPKPIRRGLAIALGAAALVTLILMIVAILDPFGTDAPFVEESTTASTTTTLTSATTLPAVPTTTAPATITTEEPAPSPLAMSWTRVDGLAAPGEQWIADVFMGGPGLIAVGQDGPIDDADAAVWYSVDGRAWTRVPHDPDVFGGPGSQYMSAVTAGGPGFVAVGYDWMSEVDGAAVWTSVDGLVWSRTPHDEAVLGGNGYPGMTDIISWKGDLLAVGRRSSGEDPATAGLWTSSDGVAWRRVPHDPEVFESEDDLGIASVVAFNSGLVAVGSEGPGVGSGGDGQSAVVWTSSDGLNWERVSGRDPVFQSLHLGQGERRFGVDGDWATMSAVAAGGPGLVAVGEDGWCTASGGCRTESAVWTSADGRTWQRQPAVDQVDRFTKMYAVVDLGYAIVATGSSDSSESGARNGPAVVWTSTDGGVTWVREPHNSEIFGSSDFNHMATAIQVGENVIGAGSMGSNAAVWIGTSQD